MICCIAIAACIAVVLYPFRGKASRDVAQAWRLKS